MESLAGRVPSEQLPRYETLLAGCGYLQDISKLCSGNIRNIRLVLNVRKYALELSSTPVIVASCHSACYYPTIQ